ncbi:ribbon-helix-helix domain-containing protein [Halopiger goleimassiliensis]|uniref:ribbon-helix-helix domain-containing protein n=1 Tax=Halopiger goleimassiliensis TaxID=1293048 RepID=UPI001E5BCA6B|nr:ribbon-helix-helix protein, CopG family [Halopiger goleimassiliensis]
MSDCPTCGNRDYHCQQCKMEELDRRHGTPADNVDNGGDDGIVAWVQDIDETWHASMYFEDFRHVAACGTMLETPVAGLSEDARWYRDDIDICLDCEATLEDDEDSIPDGGEFERASELRADGGEPMDKVTVRIPRQQLVPLDEAVDAGIWVNRSEAIRQAIADDVEMVIDSGHGTTSVVGPRPASFTRERGESSDD